MYIDTLYGEGLKNQFLLILQLYFIIKECNIDLSNDIRSDLPDQYAFAPFKRANLTIGNRLMAMLHCFSYKSMLTSLYQLPTDIYIVNILKTFSFYRICLVKLGNILLYETH